MIWLYQKWVWLIIELGHRGLISVLHNACLLFGGFRADWSARSCIIARIVSLSTKNIKVLKKVRRWSVLLLKIRVILTA